MVTTLYLFTWTYFDLLFLSFEGKFCETKFDIKFERLNQPAQIANTLGSTSIRYRSDTRVGSIGNRHRSQDLCDMDVHMILYSIASWIGRLQWIMLLVVRSAVTHCSCVTWVSWRLIAPTTQRFFRQLFSWQLVMANNKQTVVSSRRQIPHCKSFVWGIHLPQMVNNTESSSRS